MTHYSSIYSIILSILLLLGSYPASAADQITVILDWFVNPDHGPLIVARERGYFADEGLDIELVAPADSNDPPKLVAAGKAELAVSYQPALYLHVSEGLPLVRIATLVATPLTALIVLSDGPVGRIEDLRGKKVGYSLAFYKDLLLPPMLEAHGLSLDDVEAVAVNFALSQALLTRHVDATIGAFRNFELNQMDLAGQPGRAFFPEEEGVPAYDELIVVANRADLGKAYLRRFVDALERGIQYMVNHPDQAWDLFAGAQDGLDDELNRRAWRDTLPRFALRPAALDRLRYLRFAEFLEDRGLVGALPPLEQYAVEVR